MLSLEQKIIHGGDNSEDKPRLVHERLLNVAVPEAAPDGRPIPLERCVEDHLFTMVEIQRKLERRATLDSIKVKNKPETMHIEIKELDESSSATPLEPKSPLALDTDPPPYSPIRATLEPLGLADKPSYPLDQKSEFGPGHELKTNSEIRHGARGRRGTRKLEELKGWQFFNVLRE